MAHIGFIGLGTMGEPMARHLINAGHDLTVFDSSEAAMDPFNEGATAASGYDEVGTHSEVVFLSLPRPCDVECAVLGDDDSVLAGASPGTTVVDLTTSTPHTTERIAETLAERDIAMLGAPVSGGKAGAENGSLSVMIGGEPAVVEACEPLLNAFASTVIPVGERPEHGHAVKLLNNYLSMGALALTSEAIVLGEQIGLEAQTMIDVFNASTGRNSATERKFPEHVVTGTYDSGFPLALVRKDLELFTTFGEEAGTPLLLGQVVYQLASYAHNTYGNDADQTRLYDFFDLMMRAETSH